ncbi:MAG: putative glycosyltransferase [Candidatus Berkelbacteria bacterium Athens1014_28]|uniref:Putative glycosyltransferase n=1 Tax=Candidatus Berkelbacteria bacterium Athens1014_28 TaxID=2017145 RepID=A0A554LN64_9BACT|nr:MAG: putative glycosyltransferase [Candidatus Berkelbacteria bacterium Athens1014_28]
MISVICVFFGRVIVTQIQRYLYRFGYGVHKIIIIGNNQVAQELSKEIDSVKRLGMKFIGIINGLESRKITKEREKILGPISDLRKIIEKYHPDEVILTDIGINRDKILEIIEICSDEKISFKFVSDVFSIVTTKTKSTVLAGYPMMELRTIVLDGWGRIAKRFFDALSALLVLIIFSPIFLIVALMVKITSPGPVIYRQKRVGRDGQSFDFYKFRSMFSEKCDTTTKGSKWTTAEDMTKRVTPFGRFIRKTNLDELPQFWNIFIGNMSFVGPRPELPTFVDKFQKKIPDYFRRHRVKSGLTGWAQINGLKGDTSIVERVRFDIFYIENWSLGFDLKIIIKTVFLIIGEAFGGKYEYRNRS